MPESDVNRMPHGEKGPHMKIDPNAPAYPKAHVINAPNNTGWVYADHAEDGTPFATGLTIRAELAARICAGLCADRGNLKDLDAHVTKERRAPQVLAIYAVGIADALIAELNREART